jgi:hypothetical protein
MRWLVLPASCVTTTFYRQDYLLNQVLPQTPI